MIRASNLEVTRLVAASCGFFKDGIHGFSSLFDTIFNDFSKLECNDYIVNVRT